MKTCSDCLQSLPIERFPAHQRQRTKRGEPFVYLYVSKRCGECAKKARAVYRNTPEGKAAEAKAHKKYYDTHKEQISAYWRSPAGRAVKQRSLAKRTNVMTDPLPSLREETPRSFTHQDREFAQP